MTMSGLKWGDSVVKITVATAILIFASALYCDDDVEISYPKLFRGEISTHLPIAVFPSDSTNGKYIWIPIPEMGFSICPIIPFSTNNGWWEFPIHILTFFPFIEKYGALGDISIGAGFQFPPLYRMSVAYRFIEGRFYPVDGKFYAHIAEADIAVPVKGFSGAGAKFDWLFSSSFEMNGNYNTSEKKFDTYQGSVFAIAPYWKFPLKYGVLTTAYRVVLASSIVGSAGAGSTEQLKTKSVSAFEINYTYP
jgi:hypothetical protein